MVSTESLLNRSIIHSFTQPKPVDLESPAFTEVLFTMYTSNKQRFCEISTGAVG